MKKKILLGLSGSVACSKAELFVIKNSEKFEFKLLSTHSGLNYLSEEFIKSNNIYSDWSELSGSPHIELARCCLLYTSPSPRDKRQSRMPSSA